MFHRQLAGFLIWSLTREKQKESAGSWSQRPGRPGEGGWAAGQVAVVVMHFWGGVSRPHLPTPSLAQPLHKVRHRIHIPL